MSDTTTTTEVGARPAPSAAERPRPPRVAAVHRGAGLLDHRGVRWLRADPAGVVVATLFGLLAMTPSLVPRNWLVQGLASGLSAAVGYAVGVTLWWAVRRTERGQRAATRIRTAAPPRLRSAAWPVLLVTAVVATVVMLLAGAAWQRELAALMGMPSPTAGTWWLAGPVAVVVVVVFVALVRLIRHVDHLLARVLRVRAHLPRRIAAGLAAVVVLAVLATLVNGVVLREALALADSAFSGRNDETNPGTVRPSSPTRSGSPASLTPWATLGREGRTFVSGGRPPAELAAAGGHAPLDPVRAYVGLETAPDPMARADLAVAELDRAGAFSRRVVAVATTTGTGWVDAPLADDLEAVYGGDTAIVATQYSYLPSWLSFLVDRSRAEEAGRLLFDAVRARIAALPPGVPRPRLIAFGESLGSQGSEAAFSSLADVRAEADGTLWVGPPNSNRIWSALVARRDPGSTEIHPVYAGGLVVRFAGGTATPRVLGDPAPWIPPRVLYMQHPSDPVVWWSPNLIWHRPDWLAEPHGDDVLGAMAWYPVVTFWQVTVDLTNAQSTSEGHGHVYGPELLDAWLAVAAPDGWTPADTARARAVLDR